MPPDASTLLAIAGVTAGYRRLQVLWGVDLVVHERESVVLLGANGAGKTTLLKAVMNLIGTWSGSIGFAGADITRLRTDQRVRRGVVFMSETSGFPGLTIEENILIGAQFLPRSRARERIDELYTVFPALAERRHARAGSLSGGQRKMLGIAKALVGDPRLLVMDEPSAGLSPLFVKEVIALLARFRQREQRLSLLIAEQNVNFLTLADRVYTLDNGRIGFAGTVSAMQANDALRRAYFGLK
jgi:branched-chain amino acid transport system ATP-binding protein